MEETEKVFNRTFVHWDIQLPQAAIGARQAGTINKAGWTIRYLFGKERGIGIIGLLCCAPYGQRPACA